MRSAGASSPIVADASLVVDYLVAAGERGDWAVERFRAAGELAAPHVLDLEVLAALRRHVLTRRLSQRRAAAAVADLADLPIRRYPVLGLIERIWQLRGRLTPYDAAYVALAEVLAVPLVTMDGRLAGAGGHAADIVAFGG